LFQAVKVTLDIHLNEPEGDILVFLTGEFFSFNTWWLFQVNRGIASKVVCLSKDCLVCPRTGSREGKAAG